MKEEQEVDEYNPNESEPVIQQRIVNEYITIENGVITGNYITDGKVPEGAIVVNNWLGVVGDPVVYYDSDWNRKTDVELITEGIQPMPDGYKWNDTKSDIIEMSQIERIQAGLEKMPQGFKIEGGQLVPMTDEERLASGQMTQAEYDELRRGRILSELDMIDQKAIRPLRAILVGLGTDDDQERLAELERQAEEKRAELDKLTAGEQ